MLRAGSQIHIPVARLSKPAGTQHTLTADGADILLSRHGAERGPLVRIVIKNLTADAAGKLRAVKSVFMALQGLIIFRRAPLQIQHSTDQSGVIGIT